MAQQEKKHVVQVRRYAVAVIHGKGFSLVEMVVTMAILLILIGSTAIYFSGGAGKARRAATDQLIGMIEQARNKALVSRSTVMLAIVEPGTLPLHEGNCVLGLLQVEGEWDPTSLDPVSTKLLGRWRPVESGIVFLGGTIGSLANPLDLNKLSIQYTKNRTYDAEVFGIAFNARGRMVYPVGSVPTLVRIADGGYPGGVAKPLKRGPDQRVSDTWLKIGRVTGRAYEMTP